MKTLREVMKVGGIILLVSITACGLVDLFGSKQAKPDRPFSHKKHLDKELDLECSACHTKADKGEEAGMPANLKKCMMCHEEIDENKPEGKKLANLVGDPPVWSTETKLPDEVKFSHKTHVDGKVSCTDCHKGIPTSEGITAEQVKLSMEDCMSCHTDKKVSNDCSTCHSAIAKDIKPPSHLHSWKELHGKTVRMRNEENRLDRCSMCHSESACAKCHQDEAPKNHTNFWRIQGHGVQASVDRNQCATCHRTDFCDRCHSETSPRTHTASWGSGQNRHCLTCHEPLASNNCTMCHKDTASHSTAPPKPAWHNNGMNCRQCHGPGLAAPWTHVDNGDNCNGCHR